MHFLGLDLGGSNFGGIMEGPEWRGEKWRVEGNEMEWGLRDEIWDLAMGRRRERR